MKDYKSIGMVVGSLIGCLLAGALVYVHVSIIIIILVLLGTTLSGYFIGNTIQKNRK